jgi:competence protein ComEC
MAIDLIQTAICLVLGVYLSAKTDVGFMILFAVSYLFVWLVNTLIKHECNLKLLIVVAAFIVGSIGCKTASSTSTHDCGRFIGNEVTITGRISELPSISDDNFRYVLTVNRVKENDTEYDVNDRIMVTSDKSFEYDDTVEFVGTIKEFSEKLNESGFDVRRHYKSKGIFFKMYSEDGVISEQSIKNYSIYAISNRIKNKISKFISKHYTGDEAAVLNAILIGNKNLISNEFYDILIRTGTSRCLYPTYLHVMLIMSLVGLTAGFIPKKYRDILLIALLVLYALINSAQPIFLKLIILNILSIIWRKRYGYNSQDIIALTVIILTLCNPLILFDGGFVCSVSATILLHCFYMPVYNRFKLVHWKYLRHGLTAGLICFVGLLPLNAYFFGGISIYSLIATLIFIPPVVGIILVSPIVFTLTAIFGKAPFISGFIKTMLYIIINVPRKMDELISTYVILPKPGIVFLLAYIFVVAAIVFYLNEKFKKFKYTALIAAALFTSVIINQLSRINTVEVSFVNVAQGDGAVVSVPFRGNILIDGGGSPAYTSYNLGEHIFVPYLQEKGIMTIDAAFVSHYHKDHVEGIIAAIENLKVKNVFMPDVMEGSEYRTAIEYAAAKRGTKIYYISEDTLVDLRNGLTVTITVPTAKTKLVSEDENDTSLLYNVEYGDFNCLFTGDMTDFAERNLVADGKAIDCDVLKIAHHGSKTSTSSEWVDAVSPKYAVISVGENNIYGFPNNDVLERLRGVNIFRTDINGDISIKANKNGIKRIDTFK